LQGKYYRWCHIKGCNYSNSGDRYTTSDSMIGTWKLVSGKADAIDLTPSSSNPKDVQLVYEKEVQPGGDTGDEPGDQPSGKPSGQPGNKGSKTPGKPDENKPDEPKKDNTKKPEEKKSNKKTPQKKNP
nr:hypothetical protein [Lactobacillus amylovorus]